MPITFDTQQELMAFMQIFQVKEGAKAGKAPALKTTKGKPGPKPKAAKSSAPLEQPEKAKRGRKPKAAQSKATAASKTKGKRGPKPKLKATTKQAKPTKTVKAAKAKAPKAAKPKANSNRGALSQGIIQIIEQFIAEKQGFTCNDIFQKLVETLPKAPKQSVVSAASSILKKQYGHLNTESRPGAGPRPEKVYLPE